MAYEEGEEERPLLFSEFLAMLEELIQVSDDCGAYSLDGRKPEYREASDRRAELRHTIQFLGFELLTNEYDSLLLERRDQYAIREQSKSAIMYRKRQEEEYQAGLALLKDRIFTWPLGKPVPPHE